MKRITRTQARRYWLDYQGLLSRRRKANESAVTRFVRKVGCIQFDPLSIVAKNADLVLQSRFTGYSPAILERALYETRCLIDGWDKVASIIPVEDYPAFRRYRDGQRRWMEEGHPELFEVIPQVLEKIDELEVASWSSVRFDRSIDWPWGKAEIGRAALQALYQSGELGIHHRAGTQKYYAPIGKLIPEHILEASDPHPDDPEYLAWRVERRIRSVGMLPNRGSDAWYIDGLKAVERTAVIEGLVDSGRIECIEVEDAGPVYIPADEIEAVTRSPRLPKRQEARLIAPLDNLLWDRRLTEAVFGFEYRWEVYTPAAKRIYGYYVLPVLWGDRFVGRCEPVYHTKEATLEIKAWWWESDVSESGLLDDEGLFDSLRECIVEFASMLGADIIEYPKHDPSFGWMAGIQNVREYRRPED